MVDADDLIMEMADTAKTISTELGKLEGYSETEKEELYKVIGLGALKYYILKVDPKSAYFSIPKNLWIFKGIRGHLFNIPTHASSPFAYRERNRRKPRN